MKVFLGGTVNGSVWRDLFIPMLKIDYFNPVVDDWDEAAYQRELFERENCDYCLYVITPKAEGFYSIAELVDDSNKRPEKTLFIPLNNDGNQWFSEHQVKSLKKIIAMVKKNGAKVFSNMEEAASFLNQEVNV
ncbi:nucleoside 2-deoxyribosyltransferase domain-containing protein [Algivirga pacifica]|uniref:Uncharacterized protein n=1 Tax=Algivirga pacifica TaxID=1162670 RepID=A0ABP9DB74_9BACT